MARIKRDILIQYRYSESNLEDVEKRILEQYEKEGHDVSAVKKLQVYLKPEEFTAYFVINDSYAGRVGLFEN